MTLGAHEIPVLRRLRPVQFVFVADFFVAIEMEPALAALFFRTAIPGDGKGLEPAARQLDQILLERHDAEAVLDLEICELAVRAVGAHPISPFLTEKPGNHAILLKFGIAKIPEYRVLVCLLHGEVMVRALPKPILFGMTTGAGCPSHEFRWRKRRRALGGLGCGFCHPIGMLGRRKPQRTDGERGDERADSRPLDLNHDFRIALTNSSDPTPQ
ncbi:MAG: hypothetical protein ACXW1Z_19130 [Methylobacter sp.]